MSSLSVPTLVCEDVVGLIEAGSYYEPVIAELRWAPRYKAEDLPNQAPWQSVVRAGGVTATEFSRDTPSWSLGVLTVSVSLYGQCLPQDPEKVDRLLYIAGQLTAEVIKTPVLPSGIGSLETTWQSDPLFSEESLRDKNIFFSVSEFQYRVVIGA
jgi:hypothetical protein